MKVVDAGVVVDLLTGRLEMADLGSEELGVPHLLDSEVTHALRRLGRRGYVTGEQAGAAMARFVDLEFTRFPADWLRLRMWELRHDLSAYDATYVALAEAIGATALLTTDACLAQAPGVRCAVELL